jgi:anti-sigma-K factor RskA
VAQHHAVAGLIANAGVDAPPALWERISARLDHAGPATPAPRLGPVASPAPGPAAARAGRRWGGARTAWAALGAVAAAAVVAVVLLAVQVNHLDQRVSALPGARPTTLSQAVQAALVDPAAHRVTLDRTSGSGSQAALLVILPDGTAYALNTGLPPLAADRTYQLWGVVGDRVVSLGLLGSDPRQVSFTVDPAATVQRFAVTAEVAGGVVASNHAPVAQGVNTT